MQVERAEEEAVEEEVSLVRVLKEAADAQPGVPGACTGFISVSSVPLLGSDSENIVPKRREVSRLSVEDQEILP